MMYKLVHQNKPIATAKAIGEKRKEGRSSQFWPVGAGIAGGFWNSGSPRVPG
jgi:hypothetical protein